MSSSSHDSGGDEGGSSSPNSGGGSSSSSSGQPGGGVGVGVAVASPAAADDSSIPRSERQRPDEAVVRVAPAQLSAKVAMLPTSALASTAHHQPCHALHHHHTHSPSTPTVAQLHAHSALHPRTPHSDKEYTTCPLSASAGFGSIPSASTAPSVPPSPSLDYSYSSSVPDSPVSFTSISSLGSAYSLNGRRLDEELDDLSELECVEETEEEDVEREDKGKQDTDRGEGAPHSTLDGSMVDRPTCPHGALANGAAVPPSSCCVMGLSLALEVVKEVPEESLESPGNAPPSPALPSARSLSQALRHDGEGHSPPSESALVRDARQPDATLPISYEEGGDKDEEGKDKHDAPVDASSAPSLASAKPSSLSRSRDFKSVGAARHRRSTPPAHRFRHRHAEPSPSRLPSSSAVVGPVPAIAAASSSIAGPLITALERVVGEDGLSGLTIHSSAPPSHPPAVRMSPCSSNGQPSPASPAPPVSSLAGKEAVDDVHHSRPFSSPKPTVTDTADGEMDETGYEEEDEDEEDEAADTTPTSSIVVVRNEAATARGHPGGRNEVEGEESAPRSPEQQTFWATIEVEPRDFLHERQAEAHKVPLLGRPPLRPSLRHGKGRNNSSSGQGSPSPAVHSSADSTRSSTPDSASAACPGGGGNSSGGSRTSSFRSERRGRTRHSVHFSPGPPQSFKAHSPVDYDRSSCPVSNRLSRKDVEEMRELNVELGLLPGCANSNDPSDADDPACSSCSSSTTNAALFPPVPVRRRRRNSSSSVSPDRVTAAGNGCGWSAAVIRPKAATPPERLSEMTLFGDEGEDDDDEAASRRWGNGEEDDVDRGRAGRPGVVKGLGPLHGGTSDGRLRGGSAVGSSDTSCSPDAPSSTTSSGGGEEECDGEEEEEEDDGRRSRSASPGRTGLASIAGHHQSSSWTGGCGGSPHRASANGLLSPRSPCFGPRSSPRGGAAANSALRAAAARWGHEKVPSLPGTPSPTSTRFPRGAGEDGGHELGHGGGVTNLDALSVASSAGAPHPFASSSSSSNSSSCPSPPPSSSSCSPSRGPTSSAFASASGPFSSSCGVDGGRPPASPYESGYGSLGGFGSEYDMLG